MEKERIKFNKISLEIEKNTLLLFIFIGNKKYRYNKVVKGYSKMFIHWDLFYESVKTLWKIYRKGDTDLQFWVEVKK